MGCNDNENDKSYSKNLETIQDTLRIRVDESGVFRNMDEQLFGIVKSDVYHKVYIFQAIRLNDYGYEVWDDYWIINDLCIEEYDEMKKYANWVVYYEKVSNNTKNNRIYTFKKLPLTRE